MSVLVASWLANLKKAHRSVQLEGVGNLAIASVIHNSMLYPLLERLNPVNVTCDWAYFHLSGLMVILHSAHLFQELTDMFGMLGVIAVIDDYVINDSLVSCQT